MELSGTDSGLLWSLDTLLTPQSYSAATNTQTGEGVAIKKVTNVFSKKILAKRALREIKLLQHFRGHRNVCRRQLIPHRGVLTRSRLPVSMIWISLTQTISTRHISMKVNAPQDSDHTRG